MREVISSVPPTDSSYVMGGFISLSLVLAMAGLGFGGGVLLGTSTTILGVLLAIAFASIAGMAVLYHRLFHEHRIVIEYNEDLW